MRSTPNQENAQSLLKIIARGARKPQLRITILAALNKSFGEWNQVFPSATCVVTLVDRLVHRSEILAIEADSYRFKEARERAAEKAALRAARKKKRTGDHP